MATGINFERLATHINCDPATAEQSVNEGGWVDMGLFWSVDGDDLFDEQSNTDANGLVGGLFSACDITQEDLKNTEIIASRTKHAIPIEVTVSEFGLYIVGLAEQLLDVGGSDDGSLSLEAKFLKPNFSLGMHLTSEFYTERGWLDSEGKLQPFSLEDVSEYRSADSVWAVFRHTLNARLRATVSQQS